MSALQVMTFGRCGDEAQNKKFRHSFTPTCMHAIVYSFTQNSPNKKRNFTFWDYSLSHLNLVIRGIKND